MHRWKLIVGREPRGTTDLRGLFGSVYHNWTRVYAIENAETGELSGWVADGHINAVNHDIAFAARRVGVSVGAHAIRNARAAADRRWITDNPVSLCESCYTGRAGTTPRGRHRPGRHRRPAPWASAGGGSPDKRDAESRVDAIIYPDGKYEVAS